MTITTTVRLDPKLKQAVDKRAKALGMDFSEVARVLFASFSVGDISIGVTQYPDKYVKMLRAEERRMEKEYKSGKAKLYGSAKELFDDLLKR